MNSDAPSLREAPTFRSRLLAGERLAGSFVNMGSPVAAEVMGVAGFDWVVIDLEHGAGGDAAMIGQLQALASTPTAAVVRVGALEPARFIQALDAGAHGVLVPRLRSVADARACVEYAKYAGSRGVARYTRAARWGLSEWAPDETDAAIVCAVQIETREALEVVEEIAAVDGVDVLFVGPADLGHALGLGSPVDPELLSRAALVADAAARHGKAAGVLVRSPEHAAAYADLGYTMLGCASDSGLLSAAAHALSGDLAGLGARPAA